MRLDGRMFYFTSVVTIGHGLEVLVKKIKIERDNGKEERG
jgi:hypothetical protein